jgi:protocatechuate 3,4-dioxygenase alpha subunit
MLIATPSQTVGPYFRLGLDALNQVDVAGIGAHSPVTVRGQVIDANADPIPDCVIEIWQADEHGEYAFIDGKPNPKVRAGFAGFARVPTDSEGKFLFRTVQPGRVPYTDERQQAAHAVVMIGMRGLLKFLMTRLYFPDVATSEDPVLLSIDVSRRASLIGVREGDHELAWQVRTQGPGETVFFDY